MPSLRVVLDIRWQEVFENPGQTVQNQSFQGLQFSTAYEIGGALSDLCHIVLDQRRRYLGMVSFRKHDDGFGVPR